MEVMTRENDGVKEKKQYMEYIENHVSNVQLAFQKLFVDKSVSLTGLDDEYLQRLLNRLQTLIQSHDESKYSEFEFDAYRMKHYPTEAEKARSTEDTDYSSMVEEKYNQAWEHHYTHNSHHPLFWRACDSIDVDEDGVPKTWGILPQLKPVANDMTDIEILHMICDWEAMSINFSGDTVEWYVKDAVDERRDMSPKTKEKVEAWLKDIFGKDATGYEKEPEPETHTVSTEEYAKHLVESKSMTDSCTCTGNISEVE